MRTITSVNQAQILPQYVYTLLLLDYMLTGQFER